VSDETAKIRGIEGVYKFLDELPAKMQKNVVRGSLRAAAKPVLAMAKNAAPVGPPSVEGKRLYKLYAGALRDSGRLVARIRGGVVRVSVVFGGRSKKTGAIVFYAHIIEFTGAVWHMITAKNRKALSFGGLFFQSVSHPGMRPKPFLRRSADAQFVTAVTECAKYVKGKMTKQGLETSEIFVDLEDDSR
jgi:hypothetical protein